MAWLAVYRRLALRGFYIALAFDCFVSVVHADDRIRVLAGLTVAAMLVSWCRLDATAHGKSFEHGFTLPFMATWPIGVLVHLLWTRGRRGFSSYLRWSALAVLVVAAVAIAIYAFRPPARRAVHHAASILASVGERGGRGPTGARGTARHQARPLKPPARSTRGWPPAAPRAG